MMRAIACAAPLGPPHFSQHQSIHTQRSPCGASRCIVPALARYCTPVSTAVLVSDLCGPTSPRSPRGASSPPGLAL
eukprot:2474873-Alexandrium_andersonii.AAC.1